MKKFLLIIISFTLVFFFFPRMKEDLQRYRLLTEESENLEQTKTNLMKENLSRQRV